MFVRLPLSCLNFRVAAATRCVRYIGYGPQYGTNCPDLLSCRQTRYRSFPYAEIAYEAVQEMRVKARWEALDEESIQTAYAKACGKMYHAPVFANGDTRKQLLARSIHLLYKKEPLWSQSQRIRAEILFKEYPGIKKGYYMAIRLGPIHHLCKFKDMALTRLARWYDEVDKSGFLTFGKVARSIQTHYLNIINFFERRATNAAAESFNAKIKAFRAQVQRSKR